MILLWLLVLPLVGAVVCGLLPESRDRLARGVAIVTSELVLLLAVIAALRFDRDRSAVMQGVRDWTWIAPLDVHLRIGVDGISLPLVVLTALLVFLCCVYSWRHVPPGGSAGRMLALVLLLEVGMLGTFLALDLLVFFVAFEVVLVPMYFLIAVWGGARRGYAATKFFLYTLLGSTVMLLSLLALHGRTGTWDMVELARRHGAGIDPGAQRLLFVGLLVGFAIKSPLWPLHTWLPDAHSEAPTIGSVLLAGVLLKMGTYGFLRIAVPDLPQAAHDLAPLLGVLAVTAIVYGALCCLAQTDVKRLIAYSSVGHMGFVLLGVATLTPVGMDAAVFGNVAHGLITGLLFFVVGSVKERVGSYSIADIGGGLLARVPRAGSLLTFAAVASLGLPGLAGFWGELLALLGAYQPGAGLHVGLFRALMAVGLLGTLLTAGYFLYLLQRVTLGRPRETAALADATAVELLSWTPLVALVLVLGLYPRLLLAVTHAASAGLLGVAP